MKNLIRPLDTDSTAISMADDTQRGASTRSITADIQRGVTAGALGESQHGYSARFLEVQEYVELSDSSADYHYSTLSIRADVFE